MPCPPFRIFVSVYLAAIRHARKKIIRGAVIGLHLPDQSGHIVPHHCPVSCGIGEVVSASIQLGIRAGIGGVLCILAVEILAGCGAGNFSGALSLPKGGAAGTG